MEDAQHAEHFWFRILLGQLLLDEGDFARAERYLKPMEMRHRYLNAPIEFYLGQVYEGLGDEREARLHYARFVSWWEDCDPELRPMWEEGRAALQRLTPVPQL
jgi:predicted Zn-dependent protease